MRRLNNLADADLLHPGDVLIVPDNRQIPQVSGYWGGAARSGWGVGWGEVGGRGDRFRTQARTLNFRITKLRGGHLRAWA